LAKRALGRKGGNVFSGRKKEEKRRNISKKIMSCPWGQDSGLEQGGFEK